MPTTGDINWLAGLLEGEGSFGFYPKGKRGSPRIWIGMCDRDVIERCRKVMGGKSGIFERQPHARAKTNHVFSVCGVRAAGWAMTLYPLLGERRRAAVRAMLAEWRERPARVKGYLFARGY